MTAKQRVAALRDVQLDDLAAREVDCGRISLRRASMKRKIAPPTQEHGECRLKNLLFHAE